MLVSISFPASAETRRFGSLCRSHCNNRAILQNSLNQTCHAKFQLNAHLLNNIVHRVEEKE